MKSISQQIKEKPWKGWVLFILTCIVVFLLGLLASVIIERRAEAVFAYKPSVEIPENEPRLEVWGENFPKEYQSYLKTADTSFRSLFNGNANIDMLAEDPRLVILWAGYAFAKDYYQSRGHFYALDDVRNTLRTGAPKDANDGPQPNTCWTCKSPDVPRLMAQIGAEAFYKGKWASKGPEMMNFIGCLDCHDPKTMNLRISRPALVEAFQRIGIDVNKSTHQELRSLVCAQCHVEYYFKGDGKYLTFPWDSGFTVEAMERYYDKVEHVDWVHAISKAPMLKAQHPDYEVFRMGIHYQRGVACADCHMPYINEGGQKYTYHHIQSPLNMISKSCQVCHRQSEDELRQNVYERQKKCFELRIKAEDVLVRAHYEAKAAWEAGATEAEMKPILSLIRKAQWRWDYASAGHGNSFHAPLETARFFGNSIELSQEARLLLSRLLTEKGVKQPIAIPDISSKTNAQKAIGFDFAKAHEEKQQFIKTVIPKWIEAGKAREANYPKAKPCS